jgi:adenine-specific DNA-methyltransferase
MATGDETKLPLTSPDVNSARLDRLREIFPEAFTEGKIDFEKFQQVLNGDVTEAAERYGLSWSGKSEAIKNIQTLTTGTLLPTRDESVDFDTTENLIIEGDNLEVLKLLQGGYHGRVKMIYIDPPYNTGGDFIYPDNYKEGLADYLKFSGQVSGEGVRLTTNPETDEDGVICVSIGEEEYAGLRLILNEIFGEENYRNTLFVRRYDKNLNRQFTESGLKTLNVGTECICVYARSGEFTVNPVWRPASEERQTTGYWKGFWNAPDRPTMRYDILGATPVTGQWKWQKKVAYEAVANYAEYLKDFSQKMSLEEYWEHTGKKKNFIRRNPDGKGKNMGVENWISPATNGIMRSSNWTYILASETLRNLGLEFNNPKSVELITEVVKFCSDEEDIILDFFAGSGTTAQAVLELNKDGENRKYILVQLPEPTGRKDFPTIADITKERVRRVIKKLNETDSGKLPMENKQDRGFKVFKLSSSNFKVWDAVSAPKDAAGLAEQLKLMSHNVVENRTDDALLYELILKSNLPLTSKIQSGKIGTQTFYDVADGALAICLERKITQETLRGIMARNPKGVICLDIAFTGNDQLKTNIVLEMKSHGIEFHTA